MNFIWKPHRSQEISNRKCVGEALKRGNTECSLYNIKRKLLEGGLNGDWRSEGKGEDRGINNSEKPFENVI